MRKVLDGRRNGTVVAGLDAFAQTGSASRSVAWSWGGGFDDGDGRGGFGNGFCDGRDRLCDGFWGGYFARRIVVGSAFSANRYVAHEVCVPLPIWDILDHLGTLVFLSTDR
jgi:hypothetical protein